MTKTAQAAAHVSHHRIARIVAAALFGSALWFAAAPTARATPQFARRYDVGCNACHTVPPMLSAAGVAFQTSGYQAERGAPPGAAPSGSSERDSTIPMAAWITTRYEDRESPGPSDVFLPKVELISGGHLGKGWSYFVEWRIVSESLNADGTLQDRGGRFEDLFFDWQSRAGRHAARVGQYRSLNQVDVSLRLSTSEPLLFANGVRTGTDSDPRLNALDTFSPSGRSPSLGYRFQSIRGETAGDGLFHYVTIPFVGEFSIPLSDEAEDTASFELGDAKGVYLETFYRTGLKSIGGHVFSGGDGAWVATALGTWEWRRLYLVAGAGADDEDGRDRRERGSVQGEWLFTGRQPVRGAAGLRLEDVSDDGRRTDYVPYLVVSAPATRYTILIQFEYKSRSSGDVFVADLSAIF